MRVKDIGCSPDTCLNGGVCTSISNGICLCAYGYSGYNCAKCKLIKYLSSHY